MDLTLPPSVPIGAFVGAVAVGVILGVLSDRFSTRWPDHEPPEFPAGRAIGWRTVVCALFGGFAFAVLLLRFGDNILATVPWAHLDIGGTGYFRKATAWAPKGATGVTHSTLVELAMAGARDGE